MAKVLSKLATATATVAKVATVPIPCVQTQSNGVVVPVTFANLNGFIASVGGAKNVTWVLTAAGKLAVQNAPQPGINVLPYGYGGKPNHVRPTQINWLLYGMHPQYAQGITTIRNQKLSKPQQQAAVLSSRQCRHGGAYKVTPATQPVFNLHAYYRLIALCTGVPKRPCVLMALLNGGGSPCNHTFGAKTLPSFGQAIIALQVAKPVS